MNKNRNNMNNNSNKGESTKKSIFQDRSQKLKEIDDLYREEIQKIYAQSKTKVDNQNVKDKKMPVQKLQSDKIKKQGYSTINITKPLQSPKSVSTYNVPQSQSSSSKMINSASQSDQKIRASVFLKGQSTRTIEILRRQNETKELKIRQLTNKCQNLVHKLKKNLSQAQFQAQLQTLRQFSDGKMERLQYLFKIKHEEIFFKVKLQVIGLLQQFGMSKQELGQFNDISSESNLFTLMTKKLKSRLKDFRNQQQQNSFELQKDKIRNQKQQQRIHFLTQTNQLLKLSQTKLKSKIQELKLQLNQYLQRFKQRQRQYEQNQNQVFRLKKQNEQLFNINQRLNAQNKAAQSQMLEQKRLWEVKEKEMKVLLNNYFIEKKQLEDKLQEKDGDYEQLMIKVKFYEQENERTSRELIRWKQRYQLLQKQRNYQAKELEDQKNIIVDSFQKYKSTYNQAALITQKSQAEQAIRKIQEYQRAYERIVLQLQDQRRLLCRSEEQTRQKFQFQEKQWLERYKALEKIKEEEIFQIKQESQVRLRQMQESFQKRQQLYEQQTQARLRALLAQKDKRSTQELIQLQSENDELKRQINDLNKIIQVKQSLINVINNKKV